MAKARTVFVCQQCGAESIRWQGRCPGCGQWNTFAEEARAASPSQRPATGARQAPQSLSDIVAPAQPRVPSDLPEVDRILGGGIVPGSAVLVGGDPGIGKSTLLLQISHSIASTGRTVLYTTGEESALQTKLRAERLGISDARLMLLAETDVEAILDGLAELRPDMAVIDSIQSVYDPTMESAPGSVGQVRQCATRIVQLAKQIGVPVFIIGHVTKTGAIAGPRTLEHLVDTVLYFEGDSFAAYRVLRAVKNRFGSTNEIGVFEMREDGLHGVTNPSSLFLSPDDAVEPGTATVACMEGTRPLLVEIQALVSTPNFAAPRRIATGIDQRRLAILLAVLEQRCGLGVGEKDVFVSTLGGVNVTEPAADLGVALAVASAFLGRIVPRGTVMIAEVGLTGHLRSGQYMGARLEEAARQGFRQAILPKHGLPKNLKAAGLELVRETSIRDVIRRIPARQDRGGGKP